MYDLQKAGMWKRISAALFDFILASILVVGVAFVMSCALGYDDHTARLESISEEYEKKYNVDFDISEEDYEKLTKEELDIYKFAMDEFSKDKEANYVYNVLINLTFLIISISIFIAFILLEFIVPLLFGNGQTLGKKIFGIAVMREDGVKISPVVLFVRAVLGKYAVETMLPVLIILMIYMNAIGITGTVILLGILILQAILLIATDTHSVLHDKLSHTVAVDYASQRIFDTVDDLIAYKQCIHAERVSSEKSDNL